MTESLLVFHVSHGRYLLYAGCAPVNLGVAYRFPTEGNIYMYVLELSFRMSRIVFEAKPPKPYLTATSQKKKNLHDFMYIDPNSCRPSREFLGVDL